MTKNLRTGVLSGTLSLAFNQLNMDPTMPFSEAYALASALGKKLMVRPAGEINLLA